MSILLPEMGLPVSTIAVDTGLAWETNLNAALYIINTHNHSSGQGVQINPSGISINASLPFNGNSATLVQSIGFLPQLSLTTLTSLYVIGPDLFYNDGSGNLAIQLTKNGSPNGSSGTITGLPNGTASASFTAGTFVFDAATSTPANIEVASVLLGNNVAGSNFLTLSPPGSMAAGFILTLPSIPGTAGPMTLDLFGTMGTTTNDAIGQAMTSVGANAIAASRTRSVASTVGIGGVATLAVSSYTNNTASFTAVGAVTITTSGRPVRVFLAPLNTNSFSGVSVGGNIQNLSFRFQLLQGASVVGIITPDVSFASVSIQGFGVGPASIEFLDYPAAGTYTYTLNGQTVTGATFNVQNVNLVAYEL